MDVADGWLRLRQTRYAISSGAGSLTCPGPGPVTIIDCLHSARDDLGLLEAELGISGPLEMVI